VESRLKMRRLVVVVIALATATFDFPAYPQDAEKVYRIGYLTASSIHPAFRPRLRELGYIEGRNLTFVYRQAKTTEQYFGLAKELVGLKVDLILTVGVGATRETKKATRTIPIVMGNASADPVRHGLIDSLARPGGNVTGVIDLLPDLAGKRLEMLKEMFPSISRIAHVAPNPPGLNSVGRAHLRATVAAARKLGIRVLAVKVAHPDDLERVFRSLAEGNAEAVIVVGVSFFIPYRKRIVDLAAKYRLPTMHTHTRWVPLGGLLSYTTDPNLRYRRAAEYVDQIFRGKKPADLPVEQPKKYVLELNLKTARALGIKLPRSILLRATEMIE